MKDNELTMYPAAVPLYTRNLPYAVELDDGRRSTQTLRGRAAVTAMRRMLVELSSRTGQAGAMDSLEYFLGTATALEKTPYLVLVGLREDVSPDLATADDIQGAVLLHEYKVAGRGVMIFATDDGTGQRTVIAPPEIRFQVAQLACRSLIRNGAPIVLISLDGTAEPPIQEAPAGRCRVATRTRLVPRYLPLAYTLDETLALLGKHTRRNLRSYRRRAEADLGAIFVPELEMSREEFLAMNRVSTFPVADSVAAWRYDSLKLGHAGTMFAGVRARDGHWLSLIGGRRLPEVTEIDWQMNLAGLKSHSLSTVMRSYLLEDEVARGTKRLVFEGGTPHSMRHSFVEVDVTDILVRRRSLRAWVLRRFSRWIFPETNFLSSALRDPGMNWKNW